MRPSIHPRLINGPFDDPGLYIPFVFENRAMIFDLGDISCLSARDLLKISHAFITHTQMDHFIGFDRLLRTMLGRDKTLSLFGPEGFIKNVEGKLAGYSWNLVEKYNYPLALQITEVTSQSTVMRRYRCSNKFAPTDETVEKPFEGILRVSCLSCRGLRFLQPFSTTASPAWVMPSRRIFMPTSSKRV